MPNPKLEECRVDMSVWTRRGYQMQSDGRAQLSYDAYFLIFVKPVRAWRYVVHENIILQEVETSDVNLRLDHRVARSKPTREVEIVCVDYPRARIKCKSVADGYEMLTRIITRREQLKMRCICAWCGKVLREGAEPTTHGICAECKAKNFGKKEGAK